MTSNTVRGNDRMLSVYIYSICISELECAVVITVDCEDMSKLGGAPMISEGYQSQVGGYNLFIIMNVTSRHI